MVLVSARAVGRMFVPQAGAGHVPAGARRDGRYTGEVLDGGRSACRFAGGGTGGHADDSGRDGLRRGGTRAAAKCSVRGSLRAVATRGGGRYFARLIVSG